MVRKRYSGRKNNVIPYAFCIVTSQYIYIYWDPRGNVRACNSLILTVDLSRSCPTNQYFTPFFLFPLFLIYMLPPFFTSMAAGGRGGEKKKMGDNYYVSWRGVIMTVHFAINGQDLRNASRRHILVITGNLDPHKMVGAVGNTKRTQYQSDFSWLWNLFWTLQSSLSVWPSLSPSLTVSLSLSLC